VLTVGSVHAGRDNNVIPESATLRLSLRWFREATRQAILGRIDQIDSGIAIAAGVPHDRMPTRTMKGATGPLVNDSALVARIDPALTLLLGKGRVINSLPAVMGSEDFQELYVPLKTPYVLLLIGVAPVDLVQQALKEGKPVPYSNHNPDFFVDLAAIPIGTKVDVVAALSLLARPKQGQ
jgi:hippurate hydrolase